MGTKTVGLPGLTEDFSLTVVEEQAHVPALVDAEMRVFVRSGLSFVSKQGARYRGYRIFD